jgi:hypothetical protein
MRREFPALFRLNNSPNVDPFYSSDGESATNFGGFFGEFVAEREPELGGGSKDSDNGEDGIDEVVEEEESGKSGESGEEKDDEASLGGLGVEADGPGEEFGF